MASVVTKTLLGQARNLDLQKSFVLPVHILLSLISCKAAGIDVVYMTPHCNSSVQASVGGLVEPDPGLFYPENLDCTLTLIGFPTHRFLLQFARLTLESDSTGYCYDSLGVFDGNSVAGTPLTPELCGRLHMLPDVESGRSNVTFRLRTDESGRMSGFGIYYTQFTEAPCSSGQFECNNSRCIDQSLVCNTLDMCGDWSDEDTCIAPPPESRGLSPAAVLIIMVSGMILIYVIIIAVTKILHMYREKQVMKHMISQVEREMRANPYAEIDPVIGRKDDVTRLGSSASFRGKRTSKVAPL